MKKHILLIIVLSLFSTIGCQEDLEELFNNPNVYSPSGEEIVPGMFAYMIQRTASFKDQNFSWYRNINAPGLGFPMRTHLASNPHNSTVRFNNYDDHLTSFPTLGLGRLYDYGFQNFKELPLMEKRIAEMSEEEQQDMKVYAYMTRIFWLNCVLKSVDVHNAIPYSEALKGSEGLFFPKFDDPWEIYQDAMAKFKEYGDGIQSAVANLSEKGKILFNQYDIMFKGDPDKWAQLANAWRLRAAIRVSDVYPNEAGAIITEILADGNLPTEDLETPQGEDWISRSNGGPGYKGNISRWIYHMWASPEVLYWLDDDRDHVYTEGIDDPRLPALIIPNREGLYIPISYKFDVALAMTDSVQAWNNADFGYNNFWYSSNDRYNSANRHFDHDAWAHWNPFSFHSLVEPVRIFTVAEVQLLLAEAALKNLANTGSTARQHIENAVESSINYWYRINDWGEQTSPALASIPNVDDYNGKGVNFYKMSFPDKPSDAVIQAWAAKVGQDFEDAADTEAKMEVLMQQKYIDININEVLELFAELRRTRHPTLGKFREQGDLLIEDNGMVERLIYPNAPADFNTEQLSQVQDQNNYSTPIFWVPDSKHGVSPYVENDLYYYPEYPGIPETFKD